MYSPPTARQSARVVFFSVFSDRSILIQSFSHKSLPARCYPTREFLSIPCCAVSKEIFGHRTTRPELLSGLTQESVLRQAGSLALHLYTRNASGPWFQRSSRQTMHELAILHHWHTVYQHMDNALWLRGRSFKCCGIPHRLWVKTGYVGHNSRAKECPYF